MGLESATYVDDLVTTNPPTSDNVSQGDDHLRLLKSVLKTTFPNADKAFYFPDSVTKTADYSVLSTDMQKLIVADGSSATVALALPTLAASDDGWMIGVVASDISNQVSLVGTINGAANLILAQQYQMVIVYWSGTAWFAFGGLILGTAGGATIATLAATNVTISGLLDLNSVTDRMKLPNGTTAQRPGSPAEGDFRYNSSLTQVEFYDGSAWRPLPIAQPIAARYKNLVVKNNTSTPNTQIDIDADEVIVETSSGTVYRRSSINLTIDCSGTGANGLDLGGLANDTEYYHFVIYNPTTDTDAGLTSTSATAPTLPSGYTAFARVGGGFTDSSAHFYGVVQKDTRAQYTTPRTRTSGILSPWNAVSHSGYVLSTAASVIGHVGAVATVSGTATAMAAPNNSFSTSYLATSNHAPAHAFAYNANGAAAHFEFVIESANLYYGSDSSNGFLIIDGWTDNI